VATDANYTVKRIDYDFFESIGTFTIIMRLKVQSSRLDGFIYQRHGVALAVDQLGWDALTNVTLFKNREIIAEFHP